MILDDALRYARATLTRYEKQNKLEIVDSRAYQMSTRFIRVENTTDDGRVGYILLFKSLKTRDDSWVIFYPTEDDINALKKFLYLLENRILYNKKPFWSFHKNNGGYI